MLNVILIRKLFFLFKDDTVLWALMGTLDVATECDRGPFPMYLDAVLTTLSSSWAMDLSEQVEPQLQCGNPPHSAM